VTAGVCAVAGATNATRGFAVDSGNGPQPKFDYHIPRLHGSARVIGKRVSYVTATPVSKFAYNGKSVVAYTGKK
jgi:hypothetical protein